MSLRLISPAPAFGRALIDRSHRLRFRLDKQEITGFAGDTVLSAVLGSGISGAGRIDGARLRLDTAFAPNVRIVGDRTGPGIPMALCPLTDGMDLETVGARGGILHELAARFDRRSRTSLDIDFASMSAADDIGENVLSESKTDLLVIGGGVAGMTAALSGADRGQRVMLVEQRGRLGGDAVLFGNKEGEEPVLDVVAAFEVDIAARSGIEVRRFCRAIDADKAGVTVVRVEIAGGGPILIAERIKARRIVLATGCADRLPVFPGNRLPGVVGLSQAFDLASGYGVWFRGPVLFAGGTNALYHLAMLAKDSGADILRLVDHRSAPHSRFVDFAKASGVLQESGTRIARISTGSNRRLSVLTSLAWHDERNKGYAEFAAGSVVLSDGWRPRLSLWSRLGGGIEWRQGAGTVASGYMAKGVALAGSVTGLETTSGCRQSGEQAVAALNGAPMRRIAEERLADYLESPDADPLEALPSGKEPAFFASSRVLVAMPVPSDGARSRRRNRLVEPQTAGRLDLEAIDALTHAGAAPRENHIELCTERLMAPEAVPAGEWMPAQSENEPGDLPAYLAGRFGTEPVGVMLQSEDGRRFEPGMLVFVESGQTRPEDAVGVIVCASSDGGRAVLSRLEAGRVNVRGGNRTVAAAIVGQN